MVSNRGYWGCGDGEACGEGGTSAIIHDHTTLDRIHQNLNHLDMMSMTTPTPFTLFSLFFYIFCCVECANSINICFWPQPAKNIPYILSMITPIFTTSTQSLIISYAIHDHIVIYIHTNLYYINSILDHLIWYPWSHQYLPHPHTTLLLLLYQSDGCWNLPKKSTTIKNSN